MGNIKRFLEINRVLKKHGLRRYLLGKKVKNKEEVAKKMRLAFGELGPFFIKFGQFLSVNYQVVPEEFRKELEKLQDGVPHFPFSKAKEIIEKEFGRRIPEMFEKIEEIPIAAGSLAQVYRAKLKSGEIVVVKVQRPGIESVIQQDMEVLRFLAKRVDKKLKKNNVHILEMVDELEEFMQSELDFEQEAINADMFKQQELTKYEKIPKIYFHTNKVLVEEYINGIKISSLHTLHNEGIDKEKVMDNLAKSMLYHVFQDGLFHGDPHPANMLVLKDSRIAYIDFGVVGRLQPKVKRAYINQYRAILNNDPERYLDEHFKLNKLEKDKVKDYKKLKKEFENLFNEYETKKGKNAYDCTKDASEILIKYKVPDKNKIVILLRSFLALNSIIRKYGLSDKRLERIVGVLASLDNLPFGTSLGPEVMEIDFEKKMKNASVIGDMQNFMSVGKLAEMTQKLSNMEEEMNKKGELDESKVYYRGGFMLGALLLGSLGLGVYFYERLVQIASGNAIIIQSILAVISIAFIINIFLTKGVKKK